MRGVTNLSLVSQQGITGDLATEGGSPQRSVNITGWVLKPCQCLRGSDSGHLKPMLCPGLKYPWIKRR